MLIYCLSNWWTYQEALETHIEGMVAPGLGLLTGTQATLWKWHRLMDVWAATAASKRLRKPREATGRYEFLEELSSCQVSMIGDRSRCMLVGPSTEGAFVFQVTCYLRVFYWKSQPIPKVITNTKAEMGHELRDSVSWWAGSANTQMHLMVTVASQKSKLMDGEAGSLCVFSLFLLFVLLWPCLLVEMHSFLTVTQIQRLLDRKEPYLRTFLL